MALGQVLADPTGELADLRRRTATYPKALTAGAWEAEFLVGAAAKGAARADTLYVSLCLSRAVGVLVQAPFARDRRWGLNEKGALAVAETLPGAPAGFGPRVRSLLGTPGETAESLTATVALARALVEDSRRRAEGLHRVTAARGLCPGLPRNAAGDPGLPGYLPADSQDWYASAEMLTRSPFGGPEPLHDAATALHSLQSVIDQVKSRAKRGLNRLAVQAPPALRSRLV